MGEDLWQPVAQAIADGDVERVVAALERLEEADRKRLSSRARRAAREQLPGDSLAGALGKVDERQVARARAADAAAYGTGGPAAAASSWWMPGDQRFQARLIRCRDRAWRQDWAERVMRDADAGPYDWRIVRDMVVDGLVERPAGIGYVTGAVAGMHRWPDASPQGRLEPLAQTLRSDPGWLEEELWRLFEVEEADLTGRDSSAGAWGGQTWTGALIELAADGTVPRDRLLDAALGALRRDFSAHHARWYRKLYEALEPTPDEQAERLEELLALLAAPEPEIVGFAIRALERAGQPPADRLVEAIAPALLVPVKRHATRAVRLVRRTLERDPDAVPIAVPVLLAALAHEARDVQELVVEELERHRGALGDEQRAELGALAGEVDPSLRERLAALAGERPPSRPVVERELVIPAGEPPRALAPPADVEALLDRIAISLERPDDPDELELLLDGISRLRDHPVDAGRARALVERALELSLLWHGRLGFEHARDALAAVVVRWLGGPEHRAVTLAPTGRSPREAIALRVRELVDDLGAREPRSLLSTPTHSGGWIDPDEAVRRIRNLGRGTPLAMDLGQMVLRLARAAREGTCAEAVALPGEAAAVLAHALGHPGKPRFRSKLKPAWAAAEHARAPEAFAIPSRPLPDHDPRRASWIGDEDPVAPASPADLLVLEESWWGWEPGGIERWLTRVWPANREGAFHLVVRRLWMNAGTREYGVEDVLELLLDPAEPIGEQAALAVALALGSADITHRALAVDVTVAAFATQRLDGSALGARLARLLREQEEAVPSRWASTLADVAATGTSAARHVQTALEAILGAARDTDRRRLLGIVDLLRRLVIERDAPVTDPSALRFLSSLGPRSKIGRAAAEALAASDELGRATLLSRRAAHGRAGA